jgi:predicted transcriptional regulator
MSERFTEAELAVLRVLWERGESTTREITAILYPTQTHSDYATVQTLLGRLENKDAVARDRSGFVHRFAARPSRDDLVAQRLQRVAEDLCDGSFLPVIAQLADARLSARERRELRRLLGPGRQGRRR